jgi:hypothetical protein
MGTTQSDSGGTLVCKATPRERYPGPFGVYRPAGPTERAGQGNGDAGRQHRPATVGVHRPALGRHQPQDSGNLYHEVMRAGKIRRHEDGVEPEPVPLHPVVLKALLDWRAVSLYRAETDFLFPSDRLKGEKPLSPDMILRKIIRPALKEAKVEGKLIGWHSFRHSLATNLRSLGVDVKVAQELLRHANSRTTMDIYTHAVSKQKHEATRRLVELLLPQNVKSAEPQHPSAPLELRPAIA